MPCPAAETSGPSGMVERVIIDYRVLLVGWIVLWLVIFAVVWIVQGIVGSAEAAPGPKRQQARGGLHQDEGSSEGPGLGPLDPDAAHALAGQGER